MAEEVTLQDLFNAEDFQKFQDNYCSALEISAVVVDKNGHKFTRPTNWECFDKEYNGKLSAEHSRLGTYENGAGLIEFAVPIMANGQQIGAFLGGHVPAHANLDEGRLRSFASRIGLNGDDYVQLVHSLPVISENRLQQAALAVNMVLAALTRMGYYQIQLQSMAGTINSTAMQVSAAMEELAASANDVNENQKALNAEIENVSVTSSKIHDFTNLIRDIAKQTRLLGLNASIEAARAGSAGAGFAVVSEEIGKLADSSRETVDKIQDFTSQIGESVNETVAKGEATSRIVGQQTAAIADVAQELVTLSETAGALVELVNHK